MPFYVFAALDGTTAEYAVHVFVSTFVINGSTAINLKAVTVAEGIGGTANTSDFDGQEMRVSAVDSSGNAVGVKKLVGDAFTSYIEYSIGVGSDATGANFLLKTTEYGIDETFFLNVDSLDAREVITITCAVYDGPSPENVDGTDDTIKSSDASPGDNYTITPTFKQTNVYRGRKVFLKPKFTYTADGTAASELAGQVMRLSCTDDDDGDAIVQIKDPTNHQDAFANYIDYDIEDWSDHYNTVGPLDYLVLEMDIGDDNRKPADDPDPPATAGNHDLTFTVAVIDTGYTMEQTTALVSIAY